MVAERQAQTAALNMLGSREAFSAVPFFWSRHYDVSIHYVGHAEHWDEIEIEGNVANGDCLVRYLRGRKVLAVASMGRDAETLRLEAEFERLKQSRLRSPSLFTPEIDARFRAGVIAAYAEPAEAIAVGPRGYHSAKVPSGARQTGLRQECGFRSSSRTMLSSMLTPRPGPVGIPTHPSAMSNTDLSVDK